MKTRKRKIDWFKLLSFIIGIVTLLYFSICIVSYSVKTMNKALEYQPQEKTIIVK